MGSGQTSQWQRAILAIFKCLIQYLAPQTKPNQTIPNEMKPNQTKDKYKISVNHSNSQLTNQTNQTFTYGGH